MNTFSTEEVHKINGWFRYINICTKFNTAKVDGNTLMGRTIIEGFKLDPDATIKMIEDQLKDNYELMSKVIGEFNTNLIK